MQCIQLLLLILEQEVVKYAKKWTKNLTKRKKLKWCGRKEEISFLLHSSLKWLALHLHVSAFWSLQQGLKHWICVCKSDRHCIANFAVLLFSSFGLDYLCLDPISSASCWSLNYLCWWQHCSLSATKSLCFHQNRLCLYPTTYVST